MCTDVRRVQGHISWESIQGHTEPDSWAVGIYPTRIQQPRNQRSDRKLEWRNVTSVITLPAHLTLVREYRREEFPSVQGRGRCLGTECTKENGYLEICLMIDRRRKNQHGPGLGCLSCGRLPIYGCGFGGFLS